MASNIAGIGTVMANAEKWVELSRVKAEMAMRVIATDNETYAKFNRPWTDRTGNARASITGSTGAKDLTLLSALAIGVYYGRYLELDNGGKYAIVWPTMMARRSAMLDTVAGILGV